MKVRGRDLAENVAFGKEAKQSTTYTLANLAIDGDLISQASTNRGNSTVTNWWPVDFEDMKMIDEVEINAAYREWLPCSFFQHIRFPRHQALLQHTK